MSDRFGGRSRLSVHLPFTAVLVVALIGLARVGVQHWRQGSVLIGGALLLAAVLRALLSNEQAGLLAIRGRGVDMLLYSGFGLLIVVVAATIKGGLFDT